MTDHPRAQSRGSAGRARPVTRVADEGLGNEVKQMDRGGPCLLLSSFDDPARQHCLLFVSMGFRFMIRCLLARLIMIPEMRHIVGFHGQDEGII